MLHSKGILPQSYVQAAVFVCEEGNDLSLNREFKAENPNQVPLRTGPHMQGLAKRIQDLGIGNERKQNIVLVDAKLDRLRHFRLPSP
ncbi:hypothetical protein Y958_11930 [Nitrospirillum viridazoti CBAmc]|uniref:Uncharacterized protein n=1 Tax=Nitrospirillum viridazoti CBAmc TaxID=1441467 RepID=A0A248JRY0_9PROT|nr:hypothetical protein Y958_11930 [Nitrospirillum amazonense CBAmc]